MAVTIISGGITHTRNIEQTRIKPQVSTNIDLYDSNIWPLTHLTRMMRTVSVDGPYYYWYDDEYVPEWSAINYSPGYQDPAAVDLIVDNGNYYVAGDVLVVPRTGEIMRVISVAGNVLTVKRSVGATAAAALVDNDPIFKIGESFAEHTLSADPVRTKVAKRDNYTQIFKKTVEESRTSTQTAKWTVQDRAWERKKKFKLMKIDMEKTAWFGEQSEDTTGATPIRTTGGLLERITTNRTDMSAAAMTETAFRVALTNAWRYSEDKLLYMFTSSTVAARIDSWGAGKMELLPKAETYGVRINRYLTNLGELRIVDHFLFTGAIYVGYAGLVDMNQCFYRPMLDITLQTDIQENDRDGFLDQYIAEAGFQFRMEKAHTLLYGIS